MKSIIKYSLLTILFFCTCLAQGTIAVMDLDALGVSIDESKALSDRLRYELHNSGKYVVLERAMMDEILKEQGFQLSGCVRDACIVEAGKLLAVEKIVGGSISKVGSIYSVSIRIISVETGEVLGSAQKDFKTKIEYILTDGMSILIKDLISSLGARKLREVTTSKLPLYNYYGFNFSLNIPVKTFIINDHYDDVINAGEYRKSTLPGLGLSIGYFFQGDNYIISNSILSLGTDFYFFNKDRSKGLGVWNNEDIDKLNYFDSKYFYFSYKKFLPSISFTLQTLKSVKYIVPNIYIALGILPYDLVSGSYHGDWDWDGAIKRYVYSLNLGIGLNMNISRYYDIFGGFEIRTISNYYLDTITNIDSQYDPVIRFGITLTNLLFITNISIN